MNLLILRAVMFLVALIVPGGFLVLLAARLFPRRRFGLDFDGDFRRVPPTRRGRHTPVLL